MGEVAGCMMFVWMGAMLVATLVVEHRIKRCQRHLESLDRIAQIDHIAKRARRET